MKSIKLVQVFEVDPHKTHFLSAGRTIAEPRGGAPRPPERVYFSYWNQNPLARPRAPCRSTRVLQVKQTRLYTCAVVWQDIQFYTSQAPATLVIFPIGGQIHRIGGVSDDRWPKHIGWKKLQMIGDQNTQDTRDFQYSVAGIHDNR